MIESFFRWAIAALGFFLVGGTALSFSRNPHWFVRIWDFPRLQIATVLGICAVAACWLWQGTALALFLIPSLAALAWHLHSILTYTPVHAPQVKQVTPRPGRTFRLVTTNVLMQNRQFDRWLKVVRAADPDLILAMETDAGWAEAMEPLRQDYPFVISQPQGNMYGMMLWSRLELIDPEIRFLVQDDIPSFHVQVRLPDGANFRLHGIHPRPPEPADDQDSEPRDCELVVVGREVKKAGEPAVVAGDLNDVAWSHTTRLFQRLSGTLDPRVGRAPVNSFNAKNPLMRWPLDHVFFTEQFGLLEIRRLEQVGSDHFPILVGLVLQESGETTEQNAPRKRADDEEEGDEMVRREQKDD